jgi:pimeloyl-ACP methyl ester carboxylesterase
MTTVLNETDAEIGSGFTEAAVDVDGFTVRYLTAGEGDVVVALHGAGGLEKSLAYDTLAQWHRVVLVEMPGFGAQPNETHNSLAELAETVANVLTAIGIQSFALMGTSFGGAVATHLAIAHPDRVTTLVLEAPASFRVGSGDPSQLTPEQALKAFRTHPERRPAFQPPDPAASPHSWPLVGRLLAALPPDYPDLAELLPSCHVPTLVLFGDRDGIIAPENGRTYHRLMPNSAFILVHDAAHGLQYDRPEAFVDVVEDFLQRGWMFLVPEEGSIINP